MIQVLISILFVSMIPQSAKAQGGWTPPPFVCLGHVGDVGWCTTPKGAEFLKKSPKQGEAFCIKIKEKFVKGQCPPVRPDRVGAGICVVGKGGPHEYVKLSKIRIRDVVPDKANDIKNYIKHCKDLGGAVEHGDLIVKMLKQAGCSGKCLEGLE